MKLVLASNSPRRKELLLKAGFAFETCAADIDETPHTNETARDYALRMAKEKARAIAPIFGEQNVSILAADTIVVLDGKILGKPTDQNDAFAMLKSLGGRAHEVLTAYAVLCLSKNTEVSGVASTMVHFRSLTDEEILTYVATGEPMDKAGAYAIQGFAGSFVVRVIGSRSNVIGLPIEIIANILKGCLVSQ